MFQSCLTAKPIATRLNFGKRSLAWWAGNDSQNQHVGSGSGGTCGRRNAARAPRAAQAGRSENDVSVGDRQNRIRVRKDSCHGSPWAAASAPAGTASAPVSTVSAAANAVKATDSPEPASPTSTATAASCASPALSSVSGDQAAVLQDNL